MSATIYLKISLTLFTQPNIKFIIRTNKERNEGRLPCIMLLRMFLCKRSLTKAHKKFTSNERLYIIDTCVEKTNLHIVVQYMRTANDANASKPVIPHIYLT